MTIENAFHTKKMFFLLHEFIKQVHLIKTKIIKRRNFEIKILFFRVAAEISNKYYFDCVFF